MQPFLRMFLKPSLETTEENQQDAFTPGIHTQAGSPLQSTTLFTLLVPKYSFQKLQPPLKREWMYQYWDTCGVASGWRGFAFRGQYSFKCFHFIDEKHYFRVPYCMWRFRKMWHLLSRGWQSKRDNLTPRRKEMDAKTVGSNCQLHGQDICAQSVCNG